MGWGGKGVAAFFSAKEVSSLPRRTRVSLVMGGGAGVEVGEEEEDTG